MHGMLEGLPVVFAKDKELCGRGAAGVNCDAAGIMNHDSAYGAADYEVSSAGDIETSVASWGMNDFLEWDAGYSLVNDSWSGMASRYSSDRAGAAVNGKNEGYGAEDLRAFYETELERRLKTAAVLPSDLNAMMDRNCSEVLSYAMIVPELTCLSFALWKEAYVHVLLQCMIKKVCVKLHDFQLALIDTG